MNEELRKMTEEMAKAAGLEYWGGQVDALEAFAKLVAADCAKIAIGLDTYGDPVQCWLDTAADAIRAKYGLKP